MVISLPQFLKEKYSSTEANPCSYITGLARVCLQAGGRTGTELRTPSTIHPSHRPVRSATPDVLLTTVEIQFEERGKYVYGSWFKIREMFFCAIPPPLTCGLPFRRPRPFCHPPIFILLNVSHSFFPMIPVSSFQCFCFVPCCNVSLSVYIL